MRVSFDEAKAAGMSVAELTYQRRRQAFAADLGKRTGRAVDLDTETCNTTFTFVVTEDARTIASKHAEGAEKSLSDLIRWFMKHYVQSVVEYQDPAKVLFKTRLWVSEEQRNTSISNALRYREETMAKTGATGVDLVKSTRKTQIAFRVNRDAIEAFKLACEYAHEVPTLVLRRFIVQYAAGLFGLVYVSCDDVVKLLASGKI